MVAAFVILIRVRHRSAEADAHAQWWGDAEPRVAILIATYNEDVEDYPYDPEQAKKLLAEE